MNALDEFIELVTALCRNPGMFVNTGSYDGVSAYISGYSAADRDRVLGDEGWAAFARFVCARFGFPDKYVWTYVVRTCSIDDEDAIRRLGKMLVEFCELSRKKSFEEIVATAATQSARNQEREPEMALRTFLRAILNGRRKEIEPLLLEHPNNSILWKDSYPSDVVKALNSISESYPIARISGDETEGCVELMTADYPFAISVQSVEGNWMVDATKLIELSREE